MEPIKIAVDAMGGDHAPGAVVQGAVLATQEWGIPVILVGNEDLIASQLAGLSYNSDLIAIHHCTEVAGMEESPIEVIRKKKNASIRVAMELVKTGQAQALVSAGNSGATVALGVIVLGKLPGVERPALGAIIPGNESQTLLIDVGANVDCTTYQLVQFAIMAESMAKYLMKRPDPKIGILSIGEEESKGNDLVRRTAEILRKAPLNFIGNVEGGDLFNGKVDIIVCDGFIGNICLKLSEGLVEAFGAMLKKEISSGLRSKMGFLLMKPVFQHLSKKVDYAEYGGVPLLGINGVAVICHGASGPRAIMNAIRVAATTVQDQVNEHVLEGLKQYESYYRKMKHLRFWDALKRRMKTKEEIQED